MELDSEIAMPRDMPQKPQAAPKGLFDGLRLNAGPLKTQGEKAPGQGIFSNLTVPGAGLGSG